MDAADNRQELVYVVDDDSGVLATVVEILALCDFRARGFASGAEVLAAETDEPPAVALIDHRLPDTSGTQLAQDLRALYPDAAVIMLTAHSTAENAIAAIGLVDDYLVKPVPPEDMIRSVRAGAERSRLRQENRSLLKQLQVMNASLETTVAERTRELEEAHRQALADQALRERLEAQAERERLQNRLHQAHRLESLGQLAGGIAHDFNNLLGVILSYADFVAEATAHDEAVRADVEQIRAAAQQAARLTRQLLIFGRRETTQIELLDVNKIVGDMQTLLARSIGEHIEMVVERGDGMPAIRADRGQIEQVLVNLAVNARDAMRDGGRLTIATQFVRLDDAYADRHPGVATGPYVQISVTDTGVGMGPEVTSRIFEPFFTTKPADQGSGLGLAIVYGVVIESGGTITVASEPGIGSTFDVFFPAASAPAGRPAPGNGSDPSAGHGQTILVVEDEPAMLEVTSRMLRRNGYAVLGASNAAEALTLARDHDFHLLLTDAVLPVTSGRELADEIGRMRPGMSILFMSGYSHGVLGTHRVLDDGLELIHKPFTEDDLLKKVWAAIGPH